MTFSKLFFKDSLIYLFPSLVNKALSIFLVPLYTRILAPSDYGALDLLMVCGSIVNLTVALEISQGVARFYSDEKNPEQKVLYASAALWFTVFCYALFLITSFVCSSYLAGLVLGKEKNESLFRISLLFFSFNGLYLLLCNQFRWELKSKSYALVSIVVNVVTVVAAFTLAYGFELGLEGILYGMLIGSATGIFVSILYLKASFAFRLHLAYLRKMLQFSIPLVPSGIAVFISYWIDRIMINHYLSLSELGIFGLGYRIASMISLIMVGFQGSLTPLIYNYYRDDKTPAAIANIFRFFLLFSLLMFLGLTLFSKELLFLFATSKYYEASSLIILMVPATLLANMYIFAPGIGIANKSHFVLWINIVGATINTLLNWILIPRLGILGAAIATLVGNSIIFTSYMTLSQKLYKVPHNWKLLGVSSLIVVIIAFAGSQITITSVWIVALKTSIILSTIYILYSIGLVKKVEFINIANQFKGRNIRTKHPLPTKGGVNNF